MLVDAIRGILDACIALVVGAFLLFALPLLTIATTALYRGTSRRAAKSASDDDRDDGDDGTRATAAARSSPAADDEDPGAGGDLMLFVLKGMVLWMVLIQLDAAVGSAAAAWIAAFSLERSSSDPSIQLMVEPPPRALDYVYLVMVAPLLSAPAGGVHGFSAAWQVFLCAAFFWRSVRASTTSALSLSLALYAFSWSLGVFGWRRWVSALGLEPAPEESGADALKLLAGIGMLLLVGPGQTRLSLMVAALALSSDFREAVLSTSGGAARLALSLYRAAPPVAATVMASSCTLREEASTAG